MLKFFRKYNKFILVVGGSFLMVVFLLPQAIQQFGPRPDKMAAFKVDGRTYRGADLMDAARELQDLVQIQEGAWRQTGVQPFLMLYRPDNPTHWLLLVREAEQLGLIGGPESGFNLLREAARQTAQGRFVMRQGTEAAERDLENRLFESFQEARAKVIEGGTPPVMIDQSLARLQGVRRLLALSGGVPSLSTREAAHFGREFLNMGIADVALIGTGDFVDLVEEPTQAELEAHFEKYKSIDPADDAKGIGYLRPPAVQVETLQIDSGVIRDAVQLDPIEVNKFWRQNQDDFGSDFKVARLSVESMLRTQKVQQVMSKVGELLRREFFKSTRELETLQGGRKALPEDWAAKRPSYEALADQVNELVRQEVDLGERLPARATGGQAWLDRNGLLANAAARAGVVVGGQRVGFADLALSVLNDDAEFGVQEGLTFGPIDIAGSQVFYFRVLDARPASPPESLAEVEDRVRENIIDLRAYERLIADKDAIRDQVVASGGLSDLFDEFAQMDLRSGVTVTRQIARVGPGQSPLPAINDQALRDATMDLVDQWDPLDVASRLPLAERTIAVELPSAKSLAIVIVTAQRPMTAESLQRADSRIVQNARQDWMEGQAINPFSFDEVAKRLGYVPLRDSDEEEEDEEPLPGDADAVG